MRHDPADEHCLAAAPVVAPRITLEVDSAQHRGGARLRRGGEEAQREAGDHDEPRNQPVKAQAEHQAAPASTEIGGDERLAQRNARDREHARGSRAKLVRVNQVEMAQPKKRCAREGIVWRAAQTGQHHVAHAVQLRLSVARTEGHEGDVAFGRKVARKVERVALAASEQVDATLPISGQHMGHPELFRHGPQPQPRREDPRCAAQCWQWRTRPRPSRGQPCPSPRVYLDP